MENVSTGVLDKNKEHYLRCKDNAEKSCFKTYAIAYICQNRKKNEDLQSIGRPRYIVMSSLVVIKWKLFSALLAICAGNSPVAGEFPAQRPVIRSFDVFFDLRLNKRLSKQSLDWWFETPTRPLWRHCNVIPGNMSSLSNHVIYLSILFRIPSLVPAQSSANLGAREAALKNMAKINHYKTTTKYNIA